MTNLHLPFGFDNMKTSDFAKKFDNGNSCVRLYNGKGEHIMSLLPCSYCGHDENDLNKLCCDLADPDGKVLYCGIEEDLAELLCDKFGIEEIEDSRDILDSHNTIHSENPGDNILGGVNCPNCGNLPQYCGCAYF